MQWSRLRSVIALLPCAVACGAITGAAWVEVDNTSADPSSDVLAGSQWMSQPGWRTFDLFLTGTPGDQINGVNFGADLNPEYLLRVVGGVIFNHPGGASNGAVESPMLLQTSPLFNLTRFDTYATLGTLNFGGSNPSEVFAHGMSPGLQAGTQGPFIGSWYRRPEVIPLSGASFDVNGLMRILRITVSDQTVDLSGRVQVGLPLGMVTSVDVPNAIPSPGSVITLGVAGLALGCRRRR